MNKHEKMALSLFENQTFDEVDVSTLLDILVECNALYEIDDNDSYLPDAQYDFLYQFVYAQVPSDKFFTGVGSEVRGEKIKLPFTMGSLDQVYVGDMAKWILDWNLDEEKIAISDKLDGTSGMAVFDNTGEFQIAYSRGNGVEGADISRHMRKMRSFPKSLPDVTETITVRGENIFEFASFPYLQKTFTRKDGKRYKNPRNMIAGVMNAEEKEPEIYDFVKFVAYEIVGSSLSKVEQFKKLEELGFEVPYYIVYDGKACTDEKLTALLKLRKQESPYEIDGIVLDVVGAAKRGEMNPTRDTLNPAFTIKYKITSADNIMEIPVIDVEYNASSHGYWKPRVNLKPTEMGGVTVSWATGFNAKFIESNNIGPGAVLRVTRSGDVIPFIMGVITAAPEPQMPTDEYPWHWSVNDDGDEVDAILDNPEDLPIVAIKRMTRFFEKVEAPLLKLGNIEKLHNEGYDKVRIIKATEAELVSILGKNGTKVFTGLREKLTDIPLYKIMGAVSTQRGIGVRRMKKLQKAFGRDGLYKCNDPDVIASVDGFDTKTAEQAVTVIGRFIDFFADIYEFITIAEDAIVGSDSILSGEKICMTGFRDKEMAAKIEEMGGEVQSGVSGKTTMLICKDPNSNSGKVKKARDNGTRIVGIDEFKEMIRI